ncbi:TPA: archease, partial [archaeon]|nr:archease [Candidatus Naiadarchaeales archaeon SRR2090159.bin1288]
MAPYRPLEDVSIADAAFEVVGKDLNEIFRDAALATFSEMVDIYAVKGAETREIKVEAEKLDDLMFKWLEQLIYLKDAENMWFNKF